MTGMTLLQGFPEVFPSVEQSTPMMFGLVAAFSPSVFDLDDDAGEVSQPSSQVSGLTPKTGDTLKVANDVGPAELA